MRCTHTYTTHNTQIHNWSPLHTVKYSFAVHSHSKIILSLNIWTWNEFGLNLLPYEISKEKKRRTIHVSRAFKNGQCRDPTGHYSVKSCSFTLSFKCKCFCWELSVPCDIFHFQEISNLGTEAVLFPLQWQEHQIKSPISKDTHESLRPQGQKHSLFSVY